MAAPHNVQAYSDAVEDRNADAIRQLILASEFILLNIQGEDDEEEGMGALTADIEDMPVLVAFSSEENAATFVGAVSEMFEDEEEVQGFLVEGDSLLDYLPEDYGLLMDPETDDVVLIPVDISKHMHIVEEEG